MPLPRCRFARQLLRRLLDKLTPEEVDAEIDAARADKRAGNELR